MFQAIARLPVYQAQQRLAAGWLLPVSYTVSVTNDCNCRCQTCRIHERPTRSLSLDDYRRIVDSVNQPAWWLTVSGGEPFLRPDLAQLVDLLVRGLGARLITLPTNGTLPDRVAEVVERLARGWPERRFIVNVSIDEIGERNDRLRGFADSFRHARATVDRVRQLQRRLPNVTLGIHTVISRLNVDRFPVISDALLELEPDSYITEVAERRVELGTEHLDITPAALDYRAAVAHLERRLAGRRTSRLGSIIARLRSRYYRDVARFLEGGQMARRCFAGTAACHILPDGEVLACGVKGLSLGHLTRFDFQLPALWRSPRARQVREAIRREGCSCPLANQAYLNMALDPVTLATLGLEIVQDGIRAGRSPRSGSRPVG